MLALITRTAVRRGWIALKARSKALARGARQTLDIELIVQLLIFGGLMLAFGIWPK